MRKFLSRRQIQLFGFLFLLLSTAVSRVEPCEAQSDASNQSVEAAAKNLAGCYHVHLGRWWPWGMGEDSKYATPPSEIQLRLERTRLFGKDELLIRRIPPAQDLRGYAFWVPRANGQALLVWSNGFSGVSINVTKNSRDLRGWAHAHFDYPGLPHVAHVVAKPMPCPVEP